MHRFEFPASDPSFSAYKFISEFQMESVAYIFYFRLNIVSLVEYVFEIRNIVTVSK